MQKFAIIGYGNLGKSLERQIEESEHSQTVAVYSRRNICHPLARPMRELGKKRDFDVALVALGSYADVLQFADALAPLDTVDSFDTHAKIADYKRHLNDIKRNSLAIVSVGWDPGILSAARAILGMGADMVATVWGEGISQGHSNALRTIPGVLDAVQFTLPKENAKELIAQGVTDATALHKRVCFVACVEADKQRVRREVVSMPNYFDRYDTEVNFVSQAEIRRLKERTHHSGRVTALGGGFEAECQVSMRSNTDYTAKIMLAYAHALPKLKADGFLGALDVLDIPLKYLAQGNVL